MNPKVFWIQNPVFKLKMIVSFCYRRIVEKRHYPLTFRNDVPMYKFKERDVKDYLRLRLLEQDDNSVI